MEVKFYEIKDIPDSLLKFAVIISRSDGKWVMCKHRERDTYEVPGGHREAGETALEAASRELVEETGAVSFRLEPVCVYSVIGRTRVNETGEESFGLLCFADIAEFSGELNSEMERMLLMDELPDNPHKWTYPLIQPRLIEEWERRRSTYMEKVEFKEYDNMTAEEMYSLVRNVYSEGCLEKAMDSFADEEKPTLEEFEAVVEKEVENFVEFLRGFFAVKDNRYYVLEADGVPVSAARLSKIEDFYYLEALETAPSHRRKGYASRLLKDITAAYGENGSVDIRDCVMKDNAPSLATHKKCGFTIAQENGICYLYDTVSEYQYGMRYYADKI